MMKLVLVRHGESEWNKLNLFTGWTDVDLSEKGHEEAKQAAQQFAEMVSASGFAENFDAVTGEGLRDRSYTWTASVFLILAHEYLMDER